MFEQIPARAGVKRFGRIGRTGLHGEEDEFHVGTKRFNLMRGIDPVQQRHGNVQDDQVGFKTLSRLNERTAVWGCPDNLAGVFKQLVQSGQHHLVVIGQKNSWSVQRVTLSYRLTDQVEAGVVGSVGRDPLIMGLPQESSPSAG